MPPSAQFAEDLPHIDFRNPAPGNQVDPAPHPHYQKKGLEVFHIPHHMSQDRDVSHIMVQGGMSNGNLYAVQAGGLERLQQAIEERYLFRGEFLGNEVGDRIQVTPRSRSQAAA